MAKKVKPTRKSRMETQNQVPALPERQRNALDLVADGVVERYA